MKSAAQTFAEEYLTKRLGEGGFDFAVEENHAEVAKDGVDFVNCHPLSGKRQDCGRKRLMNPFIGKDGKEVKFLQPKGTMTHPYFAPSLDWPSIFDDPNIPIVIAEGETRSLAGARHGIPVVGCGGVDGVFEPGMQRGKLHPIFQSMKLKGRTIYLAFDVDAESNPRVKAAEEAAARLFSEATR